MMCMLPIDPLFLAGILLSFCLFGLACTRRDPSGAALVGGVLMTVASVAVGAWNLGEHAGSGGPFFRYMAFLFGLGTLFIAWILVSVLWGWWRSR